MYDDTLSMKKELIEIEAKYVDKTMNDVYLVGKDNLFRFSTLFYKKVEFKIDISLNW
jgi:hypothetical protein